MCNTETLRKTTLQQMTLHMQIFSFQILIPIFLAGAQQLEYNDDMN